jgi:hypothetical protein
MFGEVLSSIIYSEELTLNVYRGLAVKGVHTDFVEIKIIKVVNDVVHMTSRKIKQTSIKTLIIDKTLLVNVPPAVDIED